MKVTFKDTAPGAPEWLLSNVELIFTEPDEALCGLKIVGLSIRQGERGLWVAFPAVKGKDGKYHNYIRSATQGTKPEFRLKDAILKEWEKHLHSEDESVVPHRETDDDSVPF